MRTTADGSAEHLAECVAIEPTAIQEEFIRVPADLAYWNAQFATALETFSRAKLVFEQEEARLQLLLRERAASINKRTTEATIEAEVKCHPDYDAARLRMIVAETAKVVAYGRVDAMHSKREMLVQLGAHIRMEMKGDPTLVEQTRGARLSREGF